MNDFTKEELQTLDYLIDSYCQYSKPPEGTYAVLKNKIQSMIDSYEKYKFKFPDDMDGSVLAWKYQNE